MRAPSKSRLDEAVQKIVAEVQISSDEFDLLSARFDIQATIQLLGELDREIAYRGAIKGRPPIRGKRQGNIEEFGAILKQIKGLQKAFRKASGPALFLMFSGEDDVTSEKIPTTEIQQLVERRRQQIMRTLNYLRARCDFLLAERPGEHGSADYRQRRVAQETWRLLRRFGKEPAGGTAGTLFGDVASLLWEAVTGEADRDLQWACKAALRQADEGALRDDGPIIGRGQILLS